MIALAVPQSVKAYDFEYTYQGHTLYYNIVDGNAQVTYQRSSSPRYYNLSGNLVIPDSVTDGNNTYAVTSIGTCAFEGCSSLTSVTIPDAVTSIGGYTFYGCSGLTSVTIPAAVTSIGPAAFYGCSGLTSVTIPDAVTSIGDYAFHGCSGLTSVSIPDAVTSIDEGAFYNCSGLTEITSLSTVAPTLGNNAFGNVTSNIPVNIPCGSSMSYYSRWSYFSNFVEAAGFSFSAASANNAMGTVTILTQPTCQAPTAVFNAVANQGYHFDHWSDGNTDNPRSLTLTSDSALVAYFVQAGPDTVYIHDTIYVHDTIYITDTVYVGVDEVTVTNVKMYVQGSEVVVENAEGYTVNLYDAIGRMLATKQDGLAPVRFAVPTSGTYLVKVGDLPVRKIVVVR